MSKRYWYRGNASRIAVSWDDEGRLQIELIRPKGSTGFKKWVLPDCVFVGNAVAFYLFQHVEARDVVERLFGFMRQWGVSVIHYRGKDGQEHYYGLGDNVAVIEKFYQEIRKDFAQE